MKDIELYKLAEAARDHAYAPFSGFRVGAALLMTEGRVYTGVNVENSSYGATICAERTAFVKAISEGERHFAAIAISAGDVPSLPCGICRQFMYEFAPQIRIITGPPHPAPSALEAPAMASTDQEAVRAGSAGEGQAETGLRVWTLDQLLPEGFRLEGKE